MANEVLGTFHIVVDDRKLQRLWSRLQGHLDRLSSTHDEHFPDFERTFSCHEAQLLLILGIDGNIQYIIHFEHRVAIGYQGGEVTAYGHHVEEALAGMQVAKVFADDGGVFGKPNAHDDHLSLIEFVPALCPRVLQGFVDAPREEVFGEDGIVDAHLVQHLEIAGFDIVLTKNPRHSQFRAHRLGNAAHHDVAFGGIGHGDEQFALRNSCLTQGRERGAIARNGHQIILGVEHRKLGGILIDDKDVHLFSGKVFRKMGSD